MKEFMFFREASHVNFERIASSKKAPAILPKRVILKFAPSAVNLWPTRYQNGFSFDLPPLMDIWLSSDGLAGKMTSSFHFGYSKDMAEKA